MPVPSHSSRRFFEARRVSGVALLLACLLTSVLALRASDTARCLLADGFDFPVGKPDGTGYYKFRGFYPNGHLGEDWNGKGGGDSDLGDPIYAIGRGIVVFSENIHVGWGNCVIVRHAYRDTTGKIDMVDSLYAHLHERKVQVGQLVEKGQLVGTMGGNSGMYAVHLHFEIRKNLQIGMNRSQFARDYSNYHSPTTFITARRQLQASFQKVDIPVKTFAAYGKTLAEDPPGGSGRGTTIPIFTPKDDKKPVAPSPTATDTATTDEDDFWAKLKNKMSKGKVTDSQGQSLPPPAAPTPK
jgi:hypothetical protein